MPSRRMTLLACSLVVAGLALHARPAAADYKEVLERSVANILVAPLDAAVAPYTAWATFDQNSEGNLSTGAKITTAILFAYNYNWGTYLVLAGFREAAGVAELTTALALWPVYVFGKSQPGPFFDTKEASALVGTGSDWAFGGRWLASR